MGDKAGSKKRSGLFLARSISQRIAFYSINFFTLALAEMCPPKEVADPIGQASLRIFNGRNVRGRAVRLGIATMVLVLVIMLVILVAVVWAAWAVRSATTAVLWPLCLKGEIPIAAPHGGGGDAQCRFIHRCDKCRLCSTFLFFPNDEQRLRGNRFR